MLEHSSEPLQLLPLESLMSFLKSFFRGILIPFLALAEWIAFVWNWTKDVLFRIRHYRKASRERRDANRSRTQMERDERARSVKEQQAAGKARRLLKRNSKEAKEYQKTSIARRGSVSKGEVLNHLFAVNQRHKNADVESEPDSLGQSDGAEQNGESLNVETISDSAQGQPPVIPAEMSSSERLSSGTKLHRMPITLSGRE